MLIGVKYSEAELVLLLKQRQEKAFDYLYKNYSAALYGTILSFVKEPEVSNDLLQEVFVKIWKQADSYDETKGRLFTWMINIARNCAIDYLRSSEYKRTQENQELTESVYNMGSDSGFKEDYIGLRALTNRLKEDQRVLVDYAYYKGFTHEEIAKEIGVPAGTIKTRLRAALLQLRKLMMELLITIVALWI